MRFRGYNRNNGNEVGLSCPALEKIIHEALHRGELIKLHDYILWYNHDKEDDRNAKTTNEQAHEQA